METYPVFDSVSYGQVMSFEQVPVHSVFWYNGYKFTKLDANLYAKNGNGLVNAFNQADQQYYYLAPTTAVELNTY